MLVPAPISGAISVIGLAGATADLGLVIGRRLVRDFPVFTSYLAFHVAEAVAAFVIIHYFGRASWLYFYEYWIVQTIGLSLRFVVIYEIFRQVLRSYEGLRRAGGLLFRWVGVLLLLVGIWIAAVGPANEPDFAIRGAVVIERSINIVQCGLLVLLFLFASYFGLTWRNYVFGIALGFGVIASLELLASALATQSPSLAGDFFNLMPRLGYVLGILIWIGYLASAEPARAELKTLPQHDLEKWNRELLQLLQR